MSSVKPKAGQVWLTDGHCGVEKDKVEVEIKGTSNQSFIEYSSEDGRGSGFVSLDNFVNHFTFVPRTNLEWLAVKYDRWQWGADDFVKVYQSTGNCQSYYFKQDGFDICYQQWQEMRYELGLDTKPQKEAKMFDLSGAKVGDKYDSNNEVYTIVLVGPYDLVVNGNSRHHYVINPSTGISFCKQVQLTSKHEPRHWLKDLPDADDFHADVESIGCHNLTNGGWWYVIDKTGDTRWLPFRMPTLTGDEWKLSKISISGLKAWQEQNNAD